MVRRAAVLAGIGLEVVLRLYTIVGEADRFDVFLKRWLAEDLHAFLHAFDRAFQIVRLGKEVGVDDRQRRRVA